MAHRFDVKIDGHVTCSQCGETKADLSARAGPDGRKPPCPDAPLGNYLPRPSISVVHRYIYLSIPQIFSEANTTVSTVYLFSDSSSPSDRRSTW